MNFSNNNILTNSTLQLLVDPNDPTTDYHMNIILFIVNIVCVLLDLLLMIKLNRNNSNIVHLLVYGIIAEGFQHFCQAIIFGNQILNQYTKPIINEVGNYNVILLLPIYIRPENIDKLFRINVYIMFAAESFSLMMHICLYIELIYIMKNPIGSTSLRMKTYKFVGILIAISIYLTSAIFIDAELCSCFSFLAIIKSQKLLVMINFCLFSCSIVLGVFNILFTLRRLGCKTFFKQTFYNKFLLGQIIMMFTYYACLTPFKIISFIITTEVDIPINPTLLKYSIITFSCLGIVQFATRVLETNLYSLLGKLLKRIFFCCRNENSLNDTKDDLFAFFLNEEEPISNLLNTMMNYEFMSCILYGLKEIYYYKRRKNDLINEKRMLRKRLSSEETQKLVKGIKSQKRHKICYQKLFTEEDIGLSSKDILKNNRLTFLQELDEYSQKQTGSVFDSASSSLNSNLVDDESKSAKNDAIIIEHCPYIFENIRFEDDLDYPELLMSLDPLANKQNMLKLKESSGKSGSFFFFSYDKQFIIKTVKQHELETMLDNFMENYYDQVLDNPDSLLTRIYGLYTIEIK